MFRQLTYILSLGLLMLVSAGCGSIELNPQETPAPIIVVALETPTAEGIPAEGINAPGGLVNLSFDHDLSGWEINTICCEPTGATTNEPKWSREFGGSMKVTVSQDVEEAYASLSQRLTAPILKGSEIRVHVKTTSGPGGIGLEFWEAPRDGTRPFSSIPELHQLAKGGEYQLEWIASQEIPAGWYFVLFLNVWPGKITYWVDYIEVLPPAFCLDTITVANANDGGAGSLRQALADVCMAGTINFSSDITIQPESPLLIEKGMTIDGKGHTVVISGGNKVGVFIIDTGAIVNLEHLSIENGYAADAAGILNNGNLTLSSCILANNVADNRGGAVWNKGAITVEYSYIHDNRAIYGGGIYNEPVSISINNSTFYNNQADVGGGILSYGPGNIFNSTFANNSASDQGGGVWIATFLDITNSTFFANSAVNLGGAIIHPQGASGVVTLRNSILASSPSGGNCSGDFMDGGNNLVWGDNSCPARWNADPTLGQLGNFGGDTPTIPLLTGSPAIDAIDATACPAADQRGIPRPQGEHCDIGAFEAEQ
jgi:hypothetical protein